MKDFTEDGSLAFLHFLESKEKLPEYVKKASVPEPSDLEDLPSFSFADPVGRTHPLHNKECAFMSVVSSAGRIPASDPTMKRAVAACRDYGILDDVEQAILALDEAGKKPVEKEASDPEKDAYALVLEQPDGSFTCHYPAGNSFEVEESMMKLASDMHEERLPRAWFSEASEKLLEKAASYGVPETSIPRAVREIGRRNLPDPEYVEEQIELRKSASVPEEAASIYKEAAALAFDDPDKILDAAYVWEIADRKFGVEKTGGIVNPVSVFKSGTSFAVLEKEARERFLLLDGLVPIEAVRQIPDHELAAVLTPENASAALKIKEASGGGEATALADSMSEPSQKALARLILRHSNAA